jgi:hypothetical protein
MLKLPAKFWIVQQRLHLPGLSTKYWNMGKGEGGDKNNYRCLPLMARRRRERQEGQKRREHRRERDIHHYVRMCNIQSFMTIQE